jgi:hypothetical protein
MPISIEYQECARLMKSGAPLEEIVSRLPAQARLPDILEFLEELGRAVRLRRRMPEPKGWTARLTLALEGLGHMRFGSAS